MKIYAINQVQPKSQLNRTNLLSKRNYAETSRMYSSQPALENNISFQAIQLNSKIVKARLKARYDAKTSVLADKYLDGMKRFPTISILEFLKSHKLSKSPLLKNTDITFKILSGITKDEELSKHFIEEINANPKQADNITGMLIEKIGGPEKFQEWYYGIDGYQKAYERWSKKEVSENNEVSVNDTVKIPPNLMLEAMMQKRFATQETTNSVIGNFLKARYDAKTSALADKYLDGMKRFPTVSILEFLKSHKLSKSPLLKNADIMFKILSGITKDEELSKHFIEEINTDPKQADNITGMLIKKIGGPEKFQEWYYGVDGYQRAYERWFKKEVFENKKVSVNDMVKISPNLMLEAMMQKSLATQETTNFVIGNIPEDIGTIEDFRQITSMVRNSQLVKEFLKFRELMDDTETFMAEYPKAKEIAINPARIAKDFIKKKINDYRNPDCSQEQKSLLEKEVPFLKYMNETTIEVNGKKFTYDPILRPYSTKILFSLKPENSENKYFITMEMLNSEKNTIDKENSCIRPDSPYLNAVVDYYLKANGCENVPDVKFYDYQSNAVVYPFIKGRSPEELTRSDENGVINEYSALNNEMKSLTERGIFITDCFYQNFMFDEKNGKTMIVDNGHAKFSNALRPGVKMIHMGFADFYGRDFVSLQSSMFRAMNQK